ncbi:MAG TPA: hypothetical protein VMV28_05015 [Thermoplasmata archaeon]|nr:hypothetical protein [Thermoplasmata archaeon]
MVARSTARYRFRKNFRVSAEEAYAWLTDFDADDLKRMGSEGIREVVQLTPDVYLLIDHLRRNGRKVQKAKLVHLYPKDHAWICTYIGDPSNRSQFVYRIEPMGRRRSRFTFTGLQMEEGARAPQGVRLARYARQLQIEDSATWTRLTRQLHQALGHPRRAPAR